LESVLKSLRVKRSLLIVGLVLLVAGLATRVEALTVVGAVIALVSFVSSGGA